MAARLPESFLKQTASALLYVDTEVPASDRLTLHNSLLSFDNVPNAVKDVDLEELMLADGTQKAPPRPPADASAAEHFQYEAYLNVQGVLKDYIGGTALMGHGILDRLKAPLAVLINGSAEAFPSENTANDSQFYEFFVNAVSAQGGVVQFKTVLATQRAYMGNTGEPMDTLVRKFNNITKNFDLTHITKTWAPVLATPGSSLDNDIDVACSALSPDTYTKVVEHFTEVLDKSVIPDILERSFKLLARQARIASARDQGAEQAAIDSEKNALHNQVGYALSAVESLSARFDAEVRNVAALQSVVARLVDIVSGEPVNIARAMQIHNPPLAPDTTENRWKGIQRMLLNDVAPKFPGYVERMADNAATAQLVRHVKYKHGNKNKGGQNNTGDNPKGPKQPRTDGAGGSGSGSGSGSLAATQPNVYSG